MNVDRIFIKCLHVHTYVHHCNTNEVITYTKYHHTSDQKGRQT